jgi:hypothetical protein
MPEQKKRRTFRTMGASACRVILPLVVMWFSVSAHAAATLDLYGTFHAMGVVVTIDASDDPNGNAVSSVAYRIYGSGSPYREGFPLSRVDGTRFVGSLFWLEPGVRYQVQVTFSDPDGHPLHGVIVQGAADTREEIVVPAATKARYVSPAGTGTECTEAAPCALAQGINQAQPGEQVLLRGGTYHQGEIAVPRSGAAGAPIVIQSCPGEGAVLDGSDPAPFTWTPQGNDIYQTTVNTPDPHLVLANGERLYPYQSLPELQTLSWGIPGFYAEGTAVYVHLAGGADPNNAPMKVSRYNGAFQVDQKSHIYFLNLAFHHYGQGSYAKAIYLNDASDNLIQGCTFAINDLGIGIKRDSHRNVIELNTFYDTVFDWPWDAVKGGSNLETGGVRFYDPTAGRGNIIRRNTFHDYFDGFGACPESAGASTNETDVYENLVYRVGDDGMETDGQCSNVRIWHNTFHDVLMGISLAPVYTGPVYAIRNLIYRTGVGNNDYSGSPFKFNSGYAASGPIYLFHNTADAALAGNNGLYVKAPGSWAMIYARNNIWAGTAYAVENYNTGEPIDLDYDNLWTDSAGDLIRWNDVRYATLTDFSAATAQERHGLNDPPGFATAGANPYALRPASSLIDAGILIPGINADYQGQAPDIGAFEYAPLPTVTVRAADGAASEAGKDWGAFKISRTGDTKTDLRVQCAVLGTATNGIDYRRISRQITIKSGSSYRIIRVKPIDDHKVEGRERVRIKLMASGSGSYRIGKPPTATVRIADND